MGHSDNSNSLQLYLNANNSVVEEPDRFNGMVALAKLRFNDCILRIKSHSHLQPERCCMTQDAGKSRIEEG